MAKTNETPGQWLDVKLIGRTLSYEDVLGLMQTIQIHSTEKDYEKLQESMALKVIATLPEYP